MSRLLATGAVTFVAVGDGSGVSSMEISKSSSVVVSGFGLKFAMDLRKIFWVKF